MYYYPLCQHFCFVLVYNINLRMLVLRQVVQRITPARYLLKNLGFFMNSEKNGPLEGMGIFDSKYHLLGPL